MVLEDECQGNPRSVMCVERGNGSQSPSNGNKTGKVQNN